MTRAIIVNCKNASVRSHPWITPASKDIIGTLPAGSIVRVDISDVVYDWLDNKFYRCLSSIGDGWINSSAVSTNTRSTRLHDKNSNFIKDLDNKNLYATI